MTVKQKTDECFSDFESSLFAILVQTLHEFLCVAGRVVLHNVLRVVRVDLIDGFSEFGAGLSLDFLNFLETARLNELTLRFEVLGQNASELSANVSENIVGRETEQGLKSGNVRAHLDNVFQSLL